MSLTPEAIINIIEKCKGHVKSLEITGKSIKVVFVEPHQPADTPPSTHNQGQSLPDNVPDIPEEKNLVKNLSEGIDSDKAETQDLIDEIAIMEPHKYEALIALGEVESAEEKDN